MPVDIQAGARAGAGRHGAVKAISSGLASGSHCKTGPGKGTDLVSILETIRNAVARASSWREAWEATLSSVCHKEKRWC